MATLNQRLSSLERRTTTLEMMMATLDERIAALQGIAANHETRITALEGTSLPPPDEYQIIATLGPGDDVMGAVTFLGPKKTILLREGTYPVSLRDAFPSGLSWAETARLQAYPGEVPVFRPIAMEEPLRLDGPNLVRFVEFLGLRFDGSGNPDPTIGLSTIRLGNCQYIRLQDYEAYGSHSGMGVSITDYCFDTEHLDGRIHDNGLLVPDPAASSIENHGFYGRGDRHLLDRMEFWNHPNGWHVHLFGGTQSDYIIRRSIFRDNGMGMFDLTGGGITLGGDRNQLYLCAFWNIAGYAIEWNGSGTLTGGHLVAHNAAYQVAAMFGSPARAINSRILNNAGQAMLAGVFQGGETTALDPSNQLVTFISPPTDFHLLAALLGVTVPEVPTDLNGVPFGSSPRIGVYAT